MAPRSGPVQSCVLVFKTKAYIGRAEVTYVGLLIIYFCIMLIFAWLLDFAHWRPDFSAQKSWRPENSGLLRTLLVCRPIRTLHGPGSARGPGRTYTYSRPVKARFYRAMHFCAKRGLAIACRPSVRLSVCDVGGLWSHRFEILETNCADNYPNTFAFCSQKAIHLCQITVPGVRA